MKSMLVIGLGRFGRHLALTLSELGNEVLAMDSDEELVDEVRDGVERAQIGDCTDEDVLRELGVGDFDCCFVCIGEDFQAALEITAGLNELGAKKIVAKTDSERHARLLLRIGADEIIYPERDMAKRAAVKYTSGGALEYFELTPQYSIFEIIAPGGWVGRNIIELNIRSKYNVNIIAAKDGDRVVPVTSGDFIFREGQHILLAGDKKTIMKLVDKR